MNWNLIIRVGAGALLLLVLIVCSMSYHPVEGTEEVREGREYHVNVTQGITLQDDVVVP